MSDSGFNVVRKFFVSVIANVQKNIKNALSSKRDVDSFSIG